MDGGVTCTGVLSLMYLPTIVVIVAFVCLLFDASACIFLKASGDYRHFVPIFLHQFLPKKELARIFEHYSIKGLIVVMERSLRSLLQVVIANLVLWNFLPYWDQISNSCQVEFEHGGMYVHDNHFCADCAALSGVPCKLFVFIT